MNEPIVIMEDDFVARPAFPDAVAVAGTLIEQAGFIRFEPYEREPRLSRSRHPAYKVTERGPFELLYLADPPLCMTAYAVSPTAARALAHASATLIGPVDKFIQRTWEHRVPLYALSPATISVSEQAETSTIGKRQAKTRNPLPLFARLVYKSAGQVQRARFNARQIKALGISR